MMEDLRTRLRGRLELTSDCERVKELVLSNGKTEFGEDDTCCYGDFMLLSGHPNVLASLIIVVNEPEGVFVQYQEEPTWNSRVMVDSRNGGVGSLCDEGGQCTEIPARYFVSPDHAWKSVEYFIRERIANPELGWEAFDLKSAEAEVAKLI